MYEQRDNLTPSLFVEFGDSFATVRLRARPGLEDDLRPLSTRFNTAVQRSRSMFEVDTDELLTKLAALAEWPHPDDVTWDPRVSELATDSARDAQAMSERLSGIEVGGPLPSGGIADTLGNDWIAPLTEFQQRDISKLLSLRHGANFSVPGAGKTRVGLAVFQALRRAEGIERLLIVGPKSCYESWQDENNLCLDPPLRMEVLNRDIDPSVNVIIVNYERLAGSARSLGSWLAARPSMIILDEAHRMKLGADGTYGSACLALGPQAKRRLILTGTPAPNGAKDLENLLGFVWPGIGRQRVKQAVAGGDLRAASQALQPLFTRTTKLELGLPPVTPVLLPVAMPPLHREVYDALVR